MQINSAGGANVHLVVSDTHFGKDGHDLERRKELELVDCLRSFEPEVTSLILLGDIFECFIEYRRLVPRGFVRFQGLLAEWADRGVDITCFAGNHDPWHVDYFETEFGAKVVFDELITDVDGVRTYLHHGDGISDKSRTYNRLRPTLRHPVPVWMYRNLLPGDAGMRLAHFVSSNFGVEEIDPDVAADLRARAHELVGKGIDRVIFGHTHMPEIRRWPEGCYMNPGSWHETRTILSLERGAANLLRWNGIECEAYESTHLHAAQ